MNIIVHMAIVIIMLGSFSRIAAARPNTTVDVSVSRASSPFVTDQYNYGSVWGFGVGVTRDFIRELPKDWSDTSGSLKMCLRADLNYFRWTENAPSVSGSHTLIPLFLGFRIYWQANTYFEAGYSVAYSKFESKYTSPLNTGGSAQTYGSKGGITPGVGFEYPMSDKTMLGIHARTYMLGQEPISLWPTYAFWDLGVSIGYHF
jgi:hypothetical protein